MSIAATMPDSVLRIDWTEGIAVACAWHGKSEADAWCEANGLRVSHGICDKCAEVSLNTLRP